MFTGIIESTGKILNIRQFGKGYNVEIETGLDLSADALGDSIAVDGVCLTITKKDKSSFTALASAETISRTTLGHKKSGSAVNIERALRLSSRLGGHIVSGHIDTVSKILSKTPFGESVRFIIGLEDKYNKFVIEKGSIAIDGISLTVNTVSNDSFEVNIIPHTGESTSLTAKNAGDRVNLEFDLLGKYVEKMLHKESGGLESLLKKQGYI